MSVYIRVGAFHPLKLGEKKVLNRLGKGQSYFNPNLPKLPESDPASGWTRNSRRTGVIAVKVGMSSSIDEWGKRVPLTMLKVEDCQVVQVKTNDKEGYSALQLGIGTKKLKHLTKPQMGHFAAADVAPKRKLWEFEVTPDAIVPVGTTLSVRHFLPGQKVDVCGTSKGKGFQGAMKRWGFGGLPASHGVSLTHRSLGATGARQDPGKVWKGKKMAGQMGGDRITTRHLTVFETDITQNTLMVVGAVPGAPGGFVRITDAKGYRFEKVPPFPTYIPRPGDTQQTNLFATTPKPLLISEEDLESEMPTELTQTIKDLYPLRLTDDIQKKLESIKVKYRKELETGKIGDIIKKEFPEWLPNPEQIAKLEKEDEILKLKTAAQSAQRRDREAAHSKRTDRVFKEWAEYKKRKEEENK